MKKIFICLIGFLIFIFGFIFGLLITHYHEFESSFYSVKVTDVASILVNIIIAVVVTSLVKEKIDNNSKRRELFLELLDKLQQTIDGIHENGNEYMNKPDGQNTGKIILSSFKRANFYLGLLMSTNSNNNHIYCGSSIVNEIKADLLEFKIILTDSPFGADDRKYDDGNFQAR